MPHLFYLLTILGLCYALFKAYQEHIELAYQYHKLQQRYRAEVRDSEALEIEYTRLKYAIRDQGLEEIEDILINIEKDIDL